MTNLEELAGRLEEYASEDEGLASIAQSRTLFKKAADLRLAASALRKQEGMASQSKPILADDTPGDGVKVEDEPEWGAGAEVDVGLMIRRARETADIAISTRKLGHYTAPYAGILLRGMADRLEALSVALERDADPSTYGGDALDLAVRRLHGLAYKASDDYGPIPLSTYRDSLRIVLRALSSPNGGEAEPITDEDRAWAMDLARDLPPVETESFRPMSELRARAWRAHAQSAERQRDEALAERDRLREALEFYRSGREDEGRRARAALSPPNDTPRPSAPISDGEGGDHG